MLLLGRWKYLFSVMITMVIIHVSNAQQLPHFTDYPKAAYFFNPAYIESDARLTVSSQFINFAAGGLANGPYTTMNFVRGKLYKSEQQNLLNLTGGIGYTWDKWGPNKLNLSKLSLANELVSSSGDRLVLGVSLVRHDLFFDAANTIILGPNNIPPKVLHGVAYDIDGGVFFSGFNDKLRIGFSSQQVQTNPISWIDSPTVTPFPRYRHYFGSASYGFSVSEKVTLRPGILFQQMQSATTRPLYIGRVAVEFDNDFQVGTQYSHQHYIGAFAQSPALTALSGEINFNGMVHWMTTGVPGNTIGFQAGVTYNLPGAKD